MLVGLAAAVLCAALIPTARRLALALDVVDRPGGRKGHARATPVCGGVAMCAAGLVTAHVAAAVLTLTGPWLMVVRSASVMTAVGAIDDARPLGVSAKILGQAIPIALVMAVLPTPVFFGWSALSIVIGVIVLFLITNAINLLDNMDGLAAGLVAICAAALGFVAHEAGVEGGTMLASITVGMCLGFLPFNFPRATLFMGDAGSLGLGFLLGSLALIVAGRLEPQAWIGVLIILAVPIADTTLVITSRLARRVNPFTTPGTDHLSHRIARRTGGRISGTLVCWAVALLCAAAGTAIALPG